MNIGDKVVCIDDNFPAPIAALYTALPTEGVTYAIRDIRLGIRMHPKKEGDVSLLLVGLVNPHSNSKAALEYGFSESRFRPLEEVTTTAEQPEASWTPCPREHIHEITTI